MSKLHAFGLSLLVSLMTLPATVRADGEDCGYWSFWPNGSPRYLATYRAGSPTNGFFCTGFEGNPSVGSHFDSWSNENRKDMYMAVINNPSPSNTRVLIMAFSGQRPPSLANEGNGDKGQWNRFTGQRYDYFEPWRFGNTGDGQCDADFDYIIPHDDSVIDEIHGLSTWWASPSEAYVAAVYDTTSNQLSSNDDKGKVIDAYVSLIKARMSSNRKMVVLLGSSRGGCVAYNVARKLKSESGWENVPMILLLADPVCNPDDSHDGGVTENSGLQNPTNTNYHAHRMPNDTNFTAQARKSLRLFQVVTGDKVLVEGARTFVDSTTSHVIAGGQSWYDREQTINGHTFRWYRHEWVSYDHKTVGRTCQHQDKIDEPMKDWLIEHFGAMYCKDIATFNPNHQGCDCPAGYYYSWAQGPNQYTCQPVPQCAWDEYPAGDPMVCVKYCPDLCRDPQFDAYGEFAYCKVKSCANGGTCNQNTGACQCSYDAYLNTSTGLCTDYCPACQDPVWDTWVCPRFGSCYLTYSCQYQCASGVSCSNDICMETTKTTFAL